MNKRLLIIGGVALLLLITGGAVFLKFKESFSVVSPVEEPKPEMKLVTWEDPAGFSFSYPENIEIDPHEEDMENYAHLELTSADHPGKILIWCQETDYTDIEDWAEKEATDGQVFDSELGSQPAKKVAYSEPEKLVIATIDVDALVLVEIFPDEENYWQEIYDQILSSFTFIPLGGEEAVVPGALEAPPAGGAGEIIEEPEEVIE